MIVEVIVQALISILVFASVFGLSLTALRQPRAAQGGADEDLGESAVDRNIFADPVARFLLRPILVFAHMLNAPDLKAELRNDLITAGWQYRWTSAQYLALSFAGAVIGAVANGLLWASVGGILGGAQGTVFLQWVFHLIVLSVVLTVWLKSTRATLWLGVLQLVIWWLATLGAMHVRIDFVAVWLLDGALLGFNLTREHLRIAAKRRARRIERKLPYTLDLISLGMGAGATFVEAVDTVTRDEPDEPFNEELRALMAEIELGKTRREALMNLGRRVPVANLRSIVTAVTQAEQLGTPLTEVLRVHASLLRLQRWNRAEKLAGEAAVKLLVPSMLILIAVVLTIFLPFIVRYLRGELY